MRFPAPASDAHRMHDQCRCCAACRPAGVSHPRTPVGYLETENEGRGVTSC